MKPDPELVYAAERVIKASNADLIHKCLVWYKQWCRVGNRRGVELSAYTLRLEIQKAHAEERALQRAQRKAS
jgi:hypothetical protein